MAAFLARPMATVSASLGSFSAGPLAMVRPTRPSCATGAKVFIRAITSAGGFFLPCTKPYSMVRAISSSRRSACSAWHTLDNGPMNSSACVEPEVKAASITRPARLAMVEPHAIRRIDSHLAGGKEGLDGVLQRLARRVLNAACSASTSSV